MLSLISETTTQPHLTDAATVTDHDRTIARAAQLFAVVLPETPVPDDSEFHRWLMRAGDDTGILYLAIHRAAGKQKEESQRGFEMDSAQVGGFINKTIKRMKRA